MRTLYAKRAGFAKVELAAIPKTKKARRLASPENDRSP
jgi:hypothetical protein